MKARSVDEYIAQAPEEIRGRLIELREAIRSVAIGAEERISYSMPYYHYKGRLVYFAYAKKHIGVYAIMEPARKGFEKELLGYIQAKGTIQLPNDKPLPLQLIKKLVKAQMKINDAVLSAREHAEDRAKKK